MHASLRLLRTACASAALGLGPALLAAQSPLAAASFLERYREVERLEPMEGQVASVSHLVLTRDAARLTLERGTLWLLSPVGGRTVGAVFRGEGRFTFAPPLAAEQQALRRFAGATALDEPITEAVLLFADSTPDQLRGLTFGPGDIPGAVGAHAQDLVGSLKGSKEGAFDGGVMGPFLNGETTGYFLARLERAHGDPLLFQFDPAIAEGVRLLRPVGRIRWGANWVVVSEFAPSPAPAGTTEAWQFRHRLGVPAYRMDVRLTEGLSATLSLAASATLTLRAEERVGPWLRFGLHGKIDVDSARWGTGEPAPFFKADDDDDLWVRAPRRLEAGDSVALTVHYHGGSLIDRFGDFFFVDPGAAWFPTNRQGSSHATFDVTYHTPARYPLASIGEAADSAIADRVRTTHWVTREPTSVARFNLGLFEARHIQAEGAPPLDVLISDDAHRLMRREATRLGYMILDQRNMQEAVANDITNSLKLFASLFGDAPYRHYFVTEIPYGEGVSFPGMIDLSFSTFLTTSLDGFDAFFRAHETAHQWFGNGVRPATYRDAWLSEGLASYCGLIYLQALRRRNDDFYRFLDQYRTDIFDERDVAGAIAIGFRNATPDAPHAYDVTVYEKGAWVFQMLRGLMLDLSTMRADRFNETLRDYYQTYRGEAASTAQFQRIVEQHAGIPMDWFFDEWVRGTAIPTYHVAWRSEPADNGRFRVRLRVSQEHVPPEFRMPVLVSADLGDHRVARFRVDVRGAQGEYLSPLLPGEPREVVFGDLHTVLADVKMERW
jgi:hypothetical protein